MRLKFQPLQSFRLAASSCRRPDRAPSIPRRHLFPERRPADVRSLNAHAPVLPAVPAADQAVPVVAIRVDLQALAQPWEPAPAHAVRCIPLVQDSLVAHPALAELRAPASRLAHAPDSLPVPASRRVRVVLAEHPAERLKAAHQPACVLHVPASAAAVSATRR